MADSRIRKVFQNIFAMVSLFTIMRLSGFILLPFWAAVIVPEELAVIALLATIPKLFTTVCGLGYSIILNKIIFRFSLGKCHKWIISFMVARLFVGIIFSIVLIVSFNPINTYIFHNKVSFIAWLLIIFAGSMNIVINGFMSVARLKLFAKQFFILNFMYTILNNWIFVFIACFILGNYLASVYATFITFSILTCYSFFKFYLPLCKVKNVRFKLIRRFFLPALPQYCAGILNWVKTSIDSFVFSWLGLFPVLGILSMGKRLAGPYDEFQRSFRQPFEYIFAHDYERKNDSSKMFEVSNLFFIVMVFLVLVYDEAMRWYVSWFVKDYVSVVSILIFLLMWYLFRDLQVFLSRITLKNNNFIFTPLTTSLVSILTSVAYVIFIPRYGLNGALYSLVLVEAFVGIMGSIFVLIRYRIDFYTLFKIVLTLLIFFAMISSGGDIFLRSMTKIGVITVFILYIVAYRNKVMPQTVSIIENYFHKQGNVGK